MNNPQEIKIKDFNYSLPDERIAKYPLKERDHSKLLVYRHGKISEDVFHNLPSHLPEGALMIYNNTKVIQARLHFRKTTGALIEIFLLEPYSPSDYESMFSKRGECQWLCLVGNLKKWKEGELVTEFRMGDTNVRMTAMREGEHGTSHLISFKWEISEALDNPSTPIPTFSEILDSVGELPIPPYLNRKTEESDKKTYQTVYSKIKGSVAAPTAGLHFTEKVFLNIDAKGIERQEVTLHVGAGTFKPVKSEDIGHHDMHTEYIAVKKETIEAILSHGCEVIAVGTTSVRTLESLYYLGRKIISNPNIEEHQLHVEQWEPYFENQKEIATADALKAIIEYLDAHSATVLHASTQIIIAPGYEYKIVKILITNFHQPQSTLLLLVSAFVKGDWKSIYDYALSHSFRFLSYGDSSLIIP